MKIVSPERAVELVNDGAVLIDIREAHEHTNENIPSARHHALSQIDAQHPVQAGDKVLIFHCKSGARTKMNAGRLAASAGDCEVYLLGGGIEAWKRAGLPTSANPTGKQAASAAQGGFLCRLSSMFR
ncbi:MAG: rhodanese-like domain-containing protein [Pseudolabrys sp.]|nr:rhodanese-like domain-containing protein [Pseudolabrys sp.]MDP2294085.1 rhodanese-like domain-containing protein [Pseudolabrys sp.]